MKCKTTNCYVHIYVPKTSTEIIKLVLLSKKLKLKNERYVKGKQFQGIQKKKKVILNAR